MTPRRLLVKVCGITRQVDAEACVRHGADLVGFIFHPASPRFIEPGNAAQIDTGRALRVGVFVEQDAAEVRDIMDRARLDYAQLAGEHDPQCCRAVGPGRVIRVFRPQRHADVAGLAAEMAQYAQCMTMALLDAGTAGGGHGRTLDFAALSTLRAPVPWLLAGGLSPRTLPEALRLVAPDGFDLNSGLESAPGIKDETLVREAIRLIRTFDETNDPRADAPRGSGGCIG
ncbi:phosphoribosylanthranilate isomerase [Desulfobaculum xiamenense]|uniref:N-(5'-phosphoribosyl)anthranilate isomerase n=1 Tax=Desulfobaculum xiamenense TaxID=995050 RepID=A0A846QM57_9BACT|nr:phosphoribosylanthranilate isomerase [Desulfobaculum xiamenense]NJB68267.1 phosphoribosylanthranilate isomerase [Desulfobaculum xiamenense]